MLPCRSLNCRASGLLEQNRAPKHPVGRFLLQRPHCRMLGDGGRYPTEQSMKPSVAITLIICGTLLVLSPAIVELLQQQQVMSTLHERPDFDRVTAGKAMSSYFTITCMAIGAVMIAFPAYLSIRCPVTTQSVSAQASGKQVVSA